MKRTKLIFAFLVLALNLSGQDKPNILWIVSEDNVPMLGCYGDEFANTPNIDEFASRSILYENAFSTAPVCAPSRHTLITGMYPPSTGTEHMRSNFPIPDYVKFFPTYLKEIGYYTSNNSKKDYNTPDQPEAWDESSKTASYKNRKEGQPFFAVYNLNVTHESSLFHPVEKLRHDPKAVKLPPYHPDTPEMRHDWAQYYDKVEEMDRQFSALLKELSDCGLAENTIVFYFADNGGVLARSKRFMFESGLHVPLIIHLPEKYRQLSTLSSGSRTDRLVSFLDFAPTVLSLAGVKIPGYMQGEAFLGAVQKPEKEYIFGFRGRMDERIDMSRAVRDKQFRYIRNYLPHKIYGQYLEYLWRAPSVPSWENAYREGKLDEIQSAFWKEKPSEELYDIRTDPDNVHNLAANPQYANVLKRMRKANLDWMRKSKDVGFIPEAILLEVAKKQPLRDFAQSKSYRLKKIIETAEMASLRNPKFIPELIQRLRSRDASVRYWAATGLQILKAQAGRNSLLKALEDNEPAVRIAAAEALYYLGEKQLSVAVLIKALDNGNQAARVQAINALDNMGKDGLVALDAIKKLVKEVPEDDAYDARAAKAFIDRVHIK